MKLVQYFHGKKEMNYFEKLKTNFLIIHLLIILPVLVLYAIQVIISKTDNFLIAFSSKTIIILFLLILLIIIKKYGIKIAGKVLIVGISVILIIPINILQENIPAIFKYTNGFYTVFLLLAYSTFFANRILLLINSFLITITSTHVYLFAITQTPDNTMILESGYFNHLFMVIFITIILFFMHKFSELAINRANNETKEKEQKNKKLIIANQKIKESEAKLKNQNIELEIKVEERTIKLKEQNEGLKVLNEELAEEIEERQVVENTLKDNKIELEKSNITKDKFISIIAHDLKNPFNAMLNFSKVLYENFDDYDTQDKKNSIHYIHQAHQNTYKLLENLLTWSQLQSGKFKFKTEQTKLNLLTEETINQLRLSAENKAINIINKVEKNIIANADKNMVSTIIRNLISNAIKFTPKGGEINIYSKVNGDKFVEITVEDNGKGMNADTLGKLFQIDQTISIKGTDGETGTGLGLVLCKEFIEKHEGTIRVESEIEKGSKFIFTLPIN